jgi:hypothetical protein
VTGAPRHWTLREARAQYFRENGIEEDGGYARGWGENQNRAIAGLVPEY